MLAILTPPRTKSAQIFDDMDRVNNLSKIAREKQKGLLHRGGKAEMTGTGGAYHEASGIMSLAD